MSVRPVLPATEVTLATKARRVFLEQRNEQQHERHAATALNGRLTVRGGRGRGFRNRTTPATEGAGQGYNIRGSSKTIKTTMGMSTTVQVVPLSANGEMYS
jgi:hypothetical protein